MPYFPSPRVRASWFAWTPLATVCLTAALALAGIVGATAQTLDGALRNKDLAVIVEVDGSVPGFTKDELASAGVDIVLYCCSAYRAMNLAALNVYETIRTTGTQRDAIPFMQTRNDMYGFLDYYAYEQKLDELFKGDKTS